jgi:hypothetical protein
MHPMTMPILWAQAQPASGANNSLAAIAVRRWFGSQTLSPPQVVPSIEPLWAFLLALSALLIVSMGSQGPVQAFRNLFDLPGHFDLFRKALRRVKRAGRMVAIVIAFTVIAWTASQGLTYQQNSNRLDLISLTKSRGSIELALEHGFLAMLTPLRDVAALGDNVALLILAAVVVFRATIDPPSMGYRASNGDVHFSSHFRPRPGWATIAWGSAALYALNRLVSRGAGGGGLPIGQCLMIETILIPALMLISDGLLLAWLLAELRDAGLDNAGADRIEPFRVLNLLPGAALACAAALPARYVATFVFLVSGHLPTSVTASPIGRYIRWQLGTGLADLQAASFLFIGIAGVVAWTRGSLRSALSGYARVLSNEGARLTLVLAVAGASCGVVSAAAYFIILLLPVEAWVLAAADSYAHYATLPIGLITLAALVELAERSLPTANFANSAADEPGRDFPRDTAAASWAGASASES